MCRYHLPGFPYKMPYACFNCRISFKRNLIHFGDTETRESSVRCPNCDQAMAPMGHDFQAPRRQNKAQWRKVRLLFEADITFRSCGCTGPGYRPQTLAEAKQIVKVPTEEEIFRQDLEFGRWGHEDRQKRAKGYIRAI